VFCQSGHVEVQHLRERIVGGTHRRERQPTQSGDSSPESVIRECLQRNNGDRAKTARELGMHRSTLWRKIRQYGIEG